MNVSSKIIAAALLTASVPWLVAPAAAAPISSPTGLQNVVAPLVETVQYRRHYRGNRHGGAALGIAAGAIIGGAIIAATRPHSYHYGYSDYDPGYVYSPSYDQGYVAVSPYAGDNEVAYCQQRYRSYDPASGTYLGFDGMRYPCP